MIINEKNYNGDLIHSRIAYRFFRDEVSPVGNIVSFRAPMDVTTNLIDLEDSLSHDYIKSADAINFCWEIPNMCPSGAVAFQRLFNTNVANILFKFISKPISVKGDDIMVIDKFVGSDGVERDQGKCSVSITYSKDNVAIGHLGINIDAGLEAPGFAYSTKLSNSDCRRFMEEVNDLFNHMIKDIVKATSKVIV